MALIRCPECGKEISDKAPHCVHCGYILSKKKKNVNDIRLNKLFITMGVLIVAIFAAVLFKSYIENNNDVKKQVSMVEDILLCDYGEEVLEKYPDAIKQDDENLIIEGAFSEIVGYYEVCCWSDDEVWRVIFRWNEETKFDVEKVVDDISKSLGEYTDYDLKYDCYTWETENLEIQFYVDEGVWFDLN